MLTVPPGATGRGYPLASRCPTTRHSDTPLTLDEWGRGSFAVSPRGPVIVDPREDVTPGV